MKQSYFIRTLLPVSALLLGAPFAVTTLRAETVESEIADVKSAAIKAQLKELDGQLDRLDEFEDNAPTAEERDAAKVRIKVLKERRSELRKNYAQARYDSLRADVKGEYDKVSHWTKKTFSRSPEAKLERKLDDAGDKAKDLAHDTAQAVREAKADTMAATNPSSVTTTADIAAYKNNPSDENKAEVKASLAGLDTEIDRLEARVDDLPKGVERDATKLRVKALKERRSELASDFRKARYDALKADVKAEWNKLVH